MIPSDKSPVQDLTQFPHPLAVSVLHQRTPLFATEVHWSYSIPPYVNGNLHVSPFVVKVRHPLMFEMYRGIRITERKKLPFAFIDSNKKKEKQRIDRNNLHMMIMFSCKLIK